MNRVFGEQEHLNGNAVAKSIIITKEKPFKICRLVTRTNFQIWKLNFAAKSKISSFVCTYRIFASIIINRQRAVIADDFYCRSVLFSTGVLLGMRCDVLFDNSNQLTDNLRLS